MGIRFTCPNGHQLHVKSELGGKRGLCPQCGAKVLIPSEETSPEASMIIPLAPAEGANGGASGGSVERGVALPADAGGFNPSAPQANAEGATAPTPPPVIPALSPTPSSAATPTSLYHQRRARQERTRKVVIGVLLALTLVFVAALVWQLMGRG